MTHRFSFRLAHHIIVHGRALLWLISLTLPIVDATASAQEAEPNVPASPAPASPPTSPELPAAEAPQAATPAVEAGGSAGEQNIQSSPAPVTPVQAQSAPAAQVPATEQPADVPPREKLIRLVFGARAGYGMAFGDYVKDSAMDELTRGSVPVVLDATARLKSGLELGLYARLSFGMRGKDLESCDDCSVFGYGLGVQLNKHFNPKGSVDPWFGLGLGFESLNVTEQVKGIAFTSSGETREVELKRSLMLDAFPEALLQLGVDFGGEHLRFGPFASGSIARYSSTEAKLECDDFRCSSAGDVQVSGDIDSEQRAVHAWLLVGIRGSYLL